VKGFEEVVHFRVEGAHRALARPGLAAVQPHTAPIPAIKMTTIKTIRRTVPLDSFMAEDYAGRGPTGKK